jgi:PAS domain S-box-containing protein
MTITENMLYEIINILPASIYWKDLQGKYLGCNKYMLNLIGFDNLAQIIGKDDTQLIDNEEAKKVMAIDRNVMDNNTTVETEEYVTLFSESRIFLSIKTPLIRNNSVAGLTGVSIDVTDNKRIEALKIKEQMRFEEVVKKVTHDICSPLASLKMYLQVNQNKIPKQMLQELTSSVNGICVTADDILNLHKINRAKHMQFNDELQSTTLFLILSQAINEKKYEYQAFPLELKFSFDPKNILASAKITPASFKQMITDLINKESEINLRLESDSNQVKIIIEDRNKDIPKDSLLTQMQKIVQKDGGTMIIDSDVETGTKIVLTYPRAEPPNWIAQTIKIKPEDTVVILDDESPLHEIWGLRLKKYEPKIIIKHFTSGTKACDFINSAQNKDHLLLLSDYQLLRQNLNGLDVIEETKIKRAILVTRCYVDQRILDQAARLKVKTLPKSMAEHISIEMN